MADFSIPGGYTQKPNIPMADMSLSDLINTASRAKDFGAKTAVGNIFSQRVNPQTGMVDTKGVMEDLAQPGPHQWNAPEAIAAANAQSQQQHERARLQTVDFADNLGTLAAKKNLSRSDVEYMAVLAQAKGIDPGLVTALTHNLPSDQKGLRERLVMVQNLARGSNVVAQGATVLDPSGSGQKREVQEGTAAAMRAGVGAGAGGAPGMPKENPPGFESTSAPAAAKAAEGLQTTGADVPTQRMFLANLRHDYEGSKGTFGPTSDIERKVNAFLARVGAPTITMTPEQLSKQENFEKVIHQMALAQAAQFGATDARQAAAFGSNPSTKLSSLGVDGMLRMLEGNQDAIYAKYAAWNEWINNPENAGKENRFRKWESDFNKGFDMRPFQFARMTKEQQQKFFNSIPEKDQRTFYNKLREYSAKGWLDYNE